MVLIFHFSLDHLSKILVVLFEWYQAVVFSVLESSKCRHPIQDPPLAQVMYEYKVVNHRFLLVRSKLLLDSLPLIGKVVPSLCELELSEILLEIHL